MNAPPGTLFRPEVVEANKHRISGKVLLFLPVQTHAFAALIFATLALLTAWVTFGSYTRTETARGMLETDTPSAKVIAIRAGLVTSLLVREGDLVRAGQRLAIIQLEQIDGSGTSPAVATLTSLEAQRKLTDEQIHLSASRAAGERARVTATLLGLRQQRTDLAAEADIEKQAVTSAADVFERTRSVAEKGFVSRTETDARRQAWLAAREELARLQQQLNSIGSQEAAAQAEIARIDADKGSEVANAKASAEVLIGQKAMLNRDRAYTVTAPITGRVAGLQAALGRTAEPAVPMMTIVPEGSPLHAEIYAPTRAIGFVRPGQEVRLLYDAFPYQRFGSFSGRVLRISRTVMDPRELTEPLKIDEAVYRVEVRPADQSVRAFEQRIPLQPGMALTANLILDRRSFLAWILEPLNAVRRRNR